VATRKKIQAILIDKEGDVELHMFDVPLDVYELAVPVKDEETEAGGTFGGFNSWSTYTPVKRKIFRRIRGHAEEDLKNLVVVYEEQ
jgi:hypothetical protein